MSTNLTHIVQTESLSEKKTKNQQQSSSCLKVYNIKISHLRKQKHENQQNVYLNLTFNQKNSTSMQTKCIDLNSQEMFFEIKSRDELIKIQVLQYDSMKKLLKVSLKNVKKEFKYTHEEKKNDILMMIQRTHVSLELLKTKQCRLSKSFLVINPEVEKDSRSTQNCNSQASV